MEWLTFVSLDDLVVLSGVFIENWLFICNTDCALRLLDICVELGLMVLLLLLVHHAGGLFPCGLRS